MLEESYPAMYVGTNDKPVVLSFCCCFKVGICDHGRLLMEGITSLCETAEHVPGFQSVPEASIESELMNTQM